MYLLIIIVYVILLIIVESTSLLINYNNNLIEVSRFENSNVNKDNLILQKRNEDIIFDNYIGYFSLTENETENEAEKETENEAENEAEKETENEAENETENETENEAEKEFSIVIINEELESKELESKELESKELESKELESNYGFYIQDNNWNLLKSNTLYNFKVPVNIKIIKIKNSIQFYTEKSYINK